MVFDVSGVLVFRAFWCLMIQVGTSTAEARWTSWRVAYRRSNRLGGPARGRGHKDRSFVRCAAAAAAGLFGFLVCLFDCL